jgi:hypothetical protein
VNAVSVLVAGRVFGDVRERVFDAAWAHVWRRAGAYSVMTWHVFGDDEARVR